VNHYIKILLDPQEYNKLVGDLVNKICYQTRNRQIPFRIITIIRRNMRKKMTKY